MTQFDQPVKQNSNDGHLLAKDIRRNVDVCQSRNRNAPYCAMAYSYGTNEMQDYQSARSVMKSFPGMTTSL
jgi:hypothetical protein